MGGAAGPREPEGPHRALLRAGQRARTGRRAASRLPDDSHHPELRRRQLQGGPREGLQHREGQPGRRPLVQPSLHRRLIHAEHEHRPARPEVPGQARSASRTAEEDGDYLRPRRDGDRRSRRARPLRVAAQLPGLESLPGPQPLLPGPQHEEGQLRRLPGRRAHHRRQAPDLQAVDGLHVLRPARTPPHRPALPRPERSRSRRLRGKGDHPDRQVPGSTRQADLEGHLAPARRGLGLPRDGPRRPRLDRGQPGREHQGPRPDRDREADLGEPAARPAEAARPGHAQAPQGLRAPAAEGHASDPAPPRRASRDHRSRQTPEVRRLPREQAASSEAGREHRAVGHPVGDHRHRPEGGRRPEDQREDQVPRHHRRGRQADAHAGDLHHPAGRPPQRDGGGGHRRAQDALVRPLWAAQDHQAGPGGRPDERRVP